MMKLSTLLLAGTALASLTAATAPAQAGTVCPAAPISIGGDGCNLTYNFGSNGSITTTGPGGYFDVGADDALVGVVNNSGHAITSISFAVQPNDIFGFDGDGIGHYTGVTNSMDTSNGFYGGADAYFTPAAINSGTFAPFGPGTVNFINGGIASGTTGYFSLENPVSISHPPVLTPEPSTWAMMVLGFAGLGFAGYRTSRKRAALAV